MCKAFSFLMGILFLGLACFCALGAIAELLAIAPRFFMDSAAEDELTQEPDWAPVIAVMSRAIDIKPHDAQLRFEKARMQWRQGQSDLETAEQERALLQSAEEGLNEVVKLRPLWGRAWVELAYVQLQRKRYLKARQSLLKGLDLAANDLSSIWMIFWTGFGLYWALAPDEKERFMAVVGFAIKYRYYDDLLQAAVAYGREGLVKPLIEGSPEAQRKLQILLDARRSVARSTAL
jgi:tetratricopeptide (TPR) repeat protein